MLDENEFLSKYGFRSVSKFHLENPYTFNVEVQPHQVSYEPAESTSGMFGGNSNWRGSIWFPMNYLIIESVQKFYNYLGDNFKVECPTASGRWVNLAEVATELSQRLISIFLRDSRNSRPAHSSNALFQTYSDWQN